MTNTRAEIRAQADGQDDWSYIFNNTLDAEWGETAVVGHRFRTSELLRKADPELYNDMFKEWLDSLTDREVQELQAEIEANAD